MKLLSKIPFPFLLVSIVVFIFLLLFLQYTSFIFLQGFSPSDDGVILAQSFRILNGEIPHQDFISLRPALSGYLHSIEFYMPGALIPNGRWVVVTQYYVIASCISYVLVKTLPPFRIWFSLLLFATSGLLLFWMCGIRFYPFPWTTIDAMFFSAIGILFFFNFVKEDNFDRSTQKQIILALTFFMLASLCRQTFAVLYIFGLLTLIFRFRASGLLKRKALSVLISGVPAISYLIIVISGGPLSNLTAQLTGQTSFYDLAIAKYLDVLTADGTLYISILTLLLLGLVAARIKNTFFKKTVLISASALGLIVCVYFGHILSIGTPSIVAKAAFQLFWILLALLVLYRIVDSDNKWALLYLAIIVCCWVSSISVGNNSLSFSAGIILLSLAMSSLRVIYTYFDIKSLKITSLGAIIILFAFFFQRNFESQKFFNYRDLGQEHLSHSLDMFPGFGSIKTNANTHAYFSELNIILGNYDDIHNNFIMVPNSAVVYPLVESRNPMPSDWMQPPEYMGQEQRLEKALKTTLQSEKTYVIWDKLNNKNMHLGRSDEVHSNYSYTSIIKENCTQILEMSHFYVFCSKPEEVEP